MAKIPIGTWNLGIYSSLAWDLVIIWLFMPVLSYFFHHVIGSDCLHAAVILAMDLVTGNLATYVFLEDDDVL